VNRLSFEAKFHVGGFVILALGVVHLTLIQEPKSFKELPRNVRLSYRKSFAHSFRSHDGGLGRVSSMFKFADTTQNELFVDKIADRSAHIVATQNHNFVDFVCYIANFSIKMMAILSSMWAIWVSSFAGTQKV